jgi:hypothetical protein
MLRKTRIWLKIVKQGDLLTRIAGLKYSAEVKAIVEIGEGSWSIALTSGLCLGLQGHKCDSLCNSLVMRQLPEQLYTCDLVNLFGIHRCTG